MEWLMTQRNIEYSNLRQYPSTLHPPSLPPHCLSTLMRTHFFHQSCHPVPYPTSVRSSPTPPVPQVPHFTFYPHVLPIPYPIPRMAPALHSLSYTLLIFSPLAFDASPPISRSFLPSTISTYHSAPASSPAFSPLTPSVKRSSNPKRHL